MAGQHGRRQSTSIHPSIDRRDIADSLGVTLSKVPSRPSDSHTSTSEIMRSSLKPAPSFPITSSGRYQIPTNLANKTGRIEAPAGPRRDEVLRNSSEPESVVEVAAISSRDYEATTSLHMRPSKTLSEHRSPSTNSIPQQTIIKNLASLPSPHQPQLGSNGAQRSNLQSPPPVQHQGGASPQNLSDALSSLQLNSPNHIRDRLVSPVRNSAVTSPCFFHQRLDDAVDLDRALEEIVDDEWMSHSKLMQTATGVREVSKQLQRRPIKRAVRNVMIVTKARDNQLVTLTRQLASWLLTEPRYGSDLGVNVYVDAKLRNSKRFDAAGLLECEPRFGSMLQYWTPELCRSQPENFDLVLTLGGDGTVLFTSWLFQRIVPPILSFSLGSLGFLTNFEFSQYKTHLNRVMGESGMRVSLRMRFTCTIFRNGSIRAGVISEVVEAEQFEVLNELVIDRGPSPYVSNLELFGDGELLTVVQADGCIFSTPTGSTAYSLSAGGSLVHPDIPAILLTPICPHTLSFRPMLLNDTMLLRVSVPRSSRATAYCSFDGKGRVELRQGDYVTIAASQYPFPTVLSHPTEWFDSISRTLRWNTRGAQQKAWSGSRAGGGSDNNDDNDDVGEKEGQDWDIDTVDNLDSGVYSGDSSISASPLRQMSLLLP